MNEEEVRLVFLWERGVSVREMAQDLERQEGAIRSRLRKLNLSPPTRVARVREGPEEQVSSETKQAKRRSGTWSKREQSELLDAWQRSSKDAAAVRTIDEHFGRSAFSIIIRLHLLGAVSLERGDALAEEIGA